MLSLDYFIHTLFIVTNKSVEGKYFFKVLEYLTFLVVEFVEYKVVVTSPAKH
jgi:hypothetical protein